MRFTWLSGCLVFALSAAPAVATSVPDGHLYLGRYSGYHLNGVVRFPLYGGIPTPADLYIKPPYGGEIAASASGTVYASGATSNYFTQVGAFAFGQTKPSRVIEVPTMPYCYSDAVPDPIYGMATDPVGNLYLLINTFFSFAQHRPFGLLQPAHVSPNWQLCFGVAIFGPHQHGHETPHWEIPRYSQYYGGVAADNAANVYVDDGYTSQTVEYSTIFSHPRSRGN